MFVTIYLVRIYHFLGVPAAQSACYGLRYRFGAVRTMLTHALRMPNAGMYAKDFCGLTFDILKTVSYLCISEG
jgi:hypothetical protein